MDNDYLTSLLAILLTNLLNNHCPWLYIILKYFLQLFQDRYGCLTSYQRQWSWWKESFCSLMQLNSAVEFSLLFKWLLQVWLSHFKTKPFLSKINNIFSLCPLIEQNWDLQIGNRIKCHFCISDIFYHQWLKSSISVFFCKIDVIGLITLLFLSFSIFQ